MVHRVLGVVAGLGGTAFIGGLIAAVQSDDQSILLWIISLCGFVVLVGSGIGWILTHENSPANTTVAAKAVRAGVVQAAGRDLVTEGNVLNNINAQTIFGDVHGTAVTDGNAPTAVLRLSGRCCWLEVRNNDASEQLVVETSEFTTDSIERLRPRWNNDFEVRTLKRGESDFLRIICLEPDRPNVGRFMPVLAEYSLEPWKERIERGVRLVRFYGNDKARDRNLTVNVEQVFSFQVSVLSDKHEPVVLRFTYGVTENDTLVIPFSQRGIDEANKRGKSETDILLAYLASKMAERAKKQG